MEKGEIEMNHGNEDDNTAGNHKGHDQGKETRKEQDPGTGYYREKDPGIEHLKKSSSKERWEH